MHVSQFKLIIINLVLAFGAVPWCSHFVKQTILARLTLGGSFTTMHCSTEIAPETLKLEEHYWGTG